MGRLCRSAVVILCVLAAAPAALAADRTGPELAVAGSLLGADGAVVDEGTFTVDPVATDPGGVRSIELSIDGRVVRADHPRCCRRRAGPGEAWRIASSRYGDGVHRVVVTAVDASGNATTERADVRFAHATPLPPDAPRPTLAFDGAAPGDAAGRAVANVGDVDGDAREDVLIGAPGAGRGGAAYLVLGGPGEPASLTLMPSRRVLRFAGARPGDAAGTAVAAGGDLNGDGYRDLLIGAPGGDRSGAVHAVFGGPHLRSLRLRRLGRRGLTIRGAPGFGSVLATRRLGDFAVDGDVNGDGLDDIVAGDPAGGARVVFGKRHGTGGGYRIAGGAISSVALPGDVDHDGRGDILIVEPGDRGVAHLVYGGQGAGGLRVLGAPGDALATAGAVGDVDGDSTPDLLLGGRESAVVFVQPGRDVDLAGPFPGFKVHPPFPTAGTAQVMGTGDLDGDYAPDAAFGYDGAAFVVFSPLDEPAVDLSNLPGDRGARIDGAGGQAVDGLDALGTGAPAALSGDPGASPNGPGSGSVSVTTSDALAGADKPVAGCQPNRLWTFPLSTEHVLPRCRRATRFVDSPAFNPSPSAGQIARFNPEPACGGPSRTCQPTAYRSGNARLHGPQVGLTTDGNVDLVDSYGTRLAAIRRTQDDPRCFEVLDRALTRAGATCDPTGDPPTAHPMEIWVQGRACMASPELEQQYYLVRLLDPKGDPAAAYRELQGFVRRDQLTLGEERTTIGGATYSPQELAEAAYSGCGPRPPKRRPVPIPFEPRLPGLPTGERLFTFTDRYVSNASFQDCEGEPPPDLDPACYGPYANYQVPTLGFKDPQLPTGDPREGADWAALTVSTTGASGAGYPAHPQDGQALAAAGGGLVRAIVPRDRPFVPLDGFAYADPNVPCDTIRLARWMYGYAPGERRIYGWTPFRDPQTPRERNGLSPGCP